MHADDGIQQESATDEGAHWQDVCAIDEVLPGTGVATLIEGEQIAIVRTRHDRFYAISNFDPFSKAFVLARGIVGDKAGVPKIASPIYKQSFNLETGQCLDDANVRLAVYATRVVAGRIHVAVPDQLTKPE
jgi:nitrite reductase (NADH) small subunit